MSSGRDRRQCRHRARDSPTRPCRGRRRRPHRPQSRSPEQAAHEIDAVSTALPALIANLALELAPVRVNLIAAGFADTPLSASLLGDQLDQRREQLRATLPIGRVVGPDDSRRSPSTS